MMDKEKLATVLDLNENLEFLWEKEIPCCDLIVSDILLEIGLDAQIPVTHENITKIKHSASKIVLYDRLSSGCTCDSSRRENNSVYASEKMVWEEMVYDRLKLRSLRVKLTKVTVYENGGHYELNSYSKQFGKIGTVVLEVPVVGGLKGGVMSVAYNGRTKSLSRQENDRVFCLAAFYDCCEVSLEPVISGFKLTMEFSITWKASLTVPTNHLPVFFNVLENVKEALKTQVKNEGKIFAGVKEDILFFVLKEQYEKKKLSFQSLRGQDQILAQVLVHCELLEVHLAVVTFCEDQDRVENDNSSIIKPIRWTDIRNEVKSLKMNLSLDEHYVGPKGLKGNTILVFWPKKITVEIYGRYGALRHLINRMSFFKNSCNSPWRDYLRRVIHLCCNEPRTVWTSKCMETGELTLSLLQFCINFRAREEGLLLLKAIGSSFDTVNFEGIQNEAVAKAIADFENCFSCWADIKELMKPFLSPDRLAIVSSPVMKLAEFFLKNDCVEGAKMVADAVTIVFSEMSRPPNVVELKGFIGMFVTIQNNPETFCKKRQKLFIDFCVDKLDIISLCNLILDSGKRATTSFQRGKISLLLCEILSLFPNVHTLIIQDFFVELLNIYLTVGSQHLWKFIEKISSFPKVYDELPENFKFLKKLTFQEILTSPICELLTSSEQGIQAIILLVDCQLKQLKQETWVRERNLSDAENPVKMLSTCIRLCMQTGLETLENPRRLFKIQGILPKLTLNEMMEILTNILMNYLTEGSEKPSFIPKMFEFVLMGMKEKVTVMPSREVLTDTVKCFLKFADKSIAKSFILQVCTTEISGCWDHHLKLELMHKFMSSDIWQEIEEESKLLILNSSSDLLIVWVSDISEKMTTSTNVKELQIFECIQFLFMVERNRLYAVRSVAAHSFSLLFSKLSTLQVMEISSAILAEEKRINTTKDNLTCFNFFKDCIRLLISKDVLSVVRDSSRASEILDFLLWVNDEECWQKLALKICETMPSTESESFIDAALLIQPSLLDKSSFAVAAFEGILDFWISTQQSWKEEHFTWKQPFSMLSDYPAVEKFLRSPEEKMTYSVFTCVREAQNFSKEMNESGPKNGFSVEVLVEGKGRNSFCKISKKRSYHKTVLKVMKQLYGKLKDVKQLRDQIVEIKQVSESHGEKKNDDEEECSILPTPKRAKRDIPIVDVDVEENSSAVDSVPASISHPSTSQIASAVRDGMNSSGYEPMPLPNKSDEIYTSRHSIPSNVVSSGPRRNSDYDGFRVERVGGRCFHCNQFRCVCPRGFSQGRGRGRSVHSRYEFECNQGVPRNTANAAAAGSSGFLPVNTHSRPCFKCNQEGRMSCICSSAARGKQKQSSHVFFK